MRTQEDTDENRPYKFTMADTGEIFVLGFFPAVGICMAFPNLETFAKFIDDGAEAVEMFGPKVIKDANEILKRKQDGTAEWRDKFFPDKPNETEEENE